MLHGVPDLVAGGGYGGQRAAFEFIRGEPHRPLARIVVITSATSILHPDLLQTKTIQQMSRQFPTRPWKSLLLPVVTGEYVIHPPLGCENQQHEQKKQNEEMHNIHPVWAAVAVAASGGRCSLSRQFVYRLPDVAFPCYTAARYLPAYYTMNGFKSRIPVDPVPR